MEDLKHEQIELIVASIKNITEIIGGLKISTGHQDAVLERFNNLEEDILRLNTVTDHINELHGDLIPIREEESSEQPIEESDVPLDQPTEEVQGKLPDDEVLADVEDNTDEEVSGKIEENKEEASESSSEVQEEPSETGNDNNGTTEVSGENSDPDSGPA